MILHKEIDEEVTIKLMLLIFLWSTYCYFLYFSEYVGNFVTNFFPQIKEPVTIGDFAQFLLLP